MEINTTLSEMPHITESKFPDYLKSISRAHPGKIVYAYVRWGKVTVNIEDRQPSTDCPGTIQTFRISGGFYKNGAIIAPTKTWLKRYNFIPCRD